MIFHYTLVFTIAIIFFHSLEAEKSHEKQKLLCPSWSSLEEALNSLNFKSVDCIINSSCTAMNCTGTYQEKHFLFGVEIQACENISVTTFIINVPSLGINSWKKTLKSGEMVQIPGARLNTMLGTIEGFLCVNIKKDSSYIKLSITVKGRIRNGKTDTWPFKKDLNEMLIPISICYENDSDKVMDYHPYNASKSESSSFSSVDQSQILVKSSRKGPVFTSLLVKKSVDFKSKKSCNIFLIYTCKQNEKCVMKGNKNGICECQEGYLDDIKTGSCVANSSGLIPDSTSKSGKNGFYRLSKQIQILIVVSSSIVGCILIIILIKFLIYKCKWNVYRRLNIEADDQDLLMRDTDNAVVT